MRARDARAGAVAGRRRIGRPALSCRAAAHGARSTPRPLAADGELAIPTDVDRAGWWDGSARLGDPFGGIVVAAHVDSFDQGLGRFAELLSVRPAARSIVVQAASLTPAVPDRVGRAGAEVVRSRRRRHLLRAGREPRLVLITCGGAYDPADGGYQDNLVVIAEPDGRLDGQS